MLTRKQLELLDFIQKRMDRDGVPPSFDEMKDALELKSKSGIHRLITALEERGFIRRLAHRARALEVIKLPDNAPEQAAAPKRPGFTPSVIDGSRGKAAYVIQPMERIAQLVIVPVVQASFRRVESFEASARGEGGFGSTGSR